MSSLFVFIHEALMPQYFLYTHTSKAVSICVFFSQFPQMQGYSSKFLSHCEECFNYGAY